MMNFSCCQGDFTALLFCGEIRLLFVITLRGIENFSCIFFETMHNGQGLILGYRLMVGQRILIPSVLVRVQVAQPNRTRRHLLAFFLLFLSPYCSSEQRFYKMPKNAPFRTNGQNILLKSRSDYWEN